MPAVDYSARDIIYRPRNVRAHRVYGYSPVQQVLMTVNIALRRQMWQLDYYSEGSVPDALIGVPNSWTPDQIKQFQDYWDTEFAGDLARRRKAKFVPGDTAARVVQTKEPEHSCPDFEVRPRSRRAICELSKSKGHEQIMDARAAYGFEVPDEFAA